MRNICTRIIAAGVAIVMLFSCIKNEEPAGITAMREAKAALITAEAQYKLAEAAYKEAETAYKLLMNEYQSIQNELERLKLALQQAKDEKEIAKIQQDMELAAEQHKKAMYEALENTANAEAAYDKAMVALAAGAEAALTEAEQAEIAKIITKITRVKSSLDTAKTTYATALDTYFKAAYLNTANYEGYAAQYATRIKSLKGQAAVQAELIESLKAVDVNAAVADLQAKVEEYEAEKEANDAEKIELDKQIAALKETKTPLENQMDELEHAKSELGTQKVALVDENTELKKYNNSEVFYNVELTVAKETAHDYATILVAAATANDGVYDGIKTVTIEGVDSLTVPTGIVKFRFDDGYTDTKAFLDAVKTAVDADTDLKKAYEKNVADKIKAVENAVAANDKKIEENEAKIFDIDTKMEVLDRQIDGIEDQVDKIDYEIGLLSTDKTLIDNINSNINTIIGVYNGLINGTSIESFKLENGVVIAYTITFNATDKVPEKVAEGIEKAIEAAEATIAVLENEIAAREAAYEELLANKDITAALQLEADYAKLELAQAKQMYDYYLAQFEYWTGLLNELTTKTE